MEHRIDPEPITIVAAVAGVVGAGISAVNYWRTHHGPLPHRTRARLVRELDRLSSELRYLNADVDATEGIFRAAKFPGERTLRLGNGALLTADQFRRYQHLADQVLGRLRKIHKLALKVEGFAIGLPYLDHGRATNVTGNVVERANELLASRNLTVDKAWAELRTIVMELQKMIAQLNLDLGRSGE